MRLEKALELGNEMIDTQHRMLVVLCPKLVIAIKSGASPCALRCILLGDLFSVL